MRREPTLAERRLWNELKVWHRVGLRFRRQYVIGPFIADLACPIARLVIELDGSSHEGKAEVDERRTAYLGETGWVVLRLGNDGVTRDARRTAEYVIRVCARRLREFGVTVPQEAVRYLPDDV